MNKTYVRLRLSTAGILLNYRIHLLSSPLSRVLDRRRLFTRPFASAFVGHRDMETLERSSSKHALQDDIVHEPARKRLKSDTAAPDTPASVPPVELGAAVTESDTIEAGPSEDAQQAVKTPKSQDKRGHHSKKKDNKKGGRGRRGTRNEEADTNSLADASSEPKAPRLPKRQSALLIGFCGSGYSGMQIQPDHSKTIEGVLFQALVRAGAVSQDNADDPVKIGLARAARTDAGVHAAGNLVSLKMITSIPDVPDVVARVNEELPPEIRLWGFTRVQNSFNARLVCDSRKYTYFFPTYLLIPPKPGSGLERTLGQFVTMLSPNPAAPMDGKPLHPFWENQDLSSHEGELARKRAWRVGSEQVERLRAAAKRFEGTHNFHNFTVARDFSDRSNQRHMKKIEIADPAVYGDTEWISVLFHGQSFMLHQRKMMSALVLTCRTETPEQILDELYGPRVVFIPKMPSLGLLLEEPIFDSYNNRMATTVNAKLDPSHPDYRPPIDFDAHREAIDSFKQKYIYDNMRMVEDRDGLFDSWMRHLDAYSGNDLLYLNPKGTIPPNAIIKKNERRENPFREKKRFDATSFSVDDEAAKMEGDDEEDETKISKKDLADMEG